MGGASPGGPLSADAQSQIELLQLKINDQTKQIATLTQEKADIEKTASEASASGAANAGNSGDSQALKDLQGKYAELENRLQEYSVIEDDLVNLGRLMRENTKLKELLTEKGIPLPQYGHRSFEDGCSGFRASPSSGPKSRGSRRCNYGPNERRSRTTKRSYSCSSCCPSCSSCCPSCSSCCPSCSCCPSRGRRCNCSSVNSCSTTGCSKPYRSTAT